MGFKPVFKLIPIILLLPIDILHHLSYYSPAFAYLSLLISHFLPRAHNHTIIYLQP